MQKRGIRDVTSLQLNSSSPFFGIARQSDVAVKTQVSCKKKKKTNITDPRRKQLHSRFFCYFHFLSEIIRDLLFSGAANPFQKIKPQDVSDG